MSTEFLAFKKGSFMNIADLVNDKINNMNRKEIQNYVTNYYGVLGKESKVSFLAEEKNAIVFSCINEGIEQFFFAGENQVIIDVLESVNRPHVIEIVSRKNNIIWLEKIGYKRFMTLRRCHKKIFVNNSFSLDNLKICVADRSCTEMIMKLIKRKFDFINARYLTFEKLEQNIDAGTVWVVRQGSDNIGGFLVASIVKSTLCLEIVYNGLSEFKAGYFLKTAENYALKNNLKLVYAWADISNMRAGAMYNGNDYTWEERYKTFFTKGRINI